MKQPNRVKSAMRAGRKAYGYNLSFPSPWVIDILGNLDFDFVFIDGEHGPFGLDQLEDAIVVEVFKARIPGPGTMGNSGFRRAINPWSESALYSLVLSGAGPKEMSFLQGKRRADVAYCHIEGAIVVYIAEIDAHAFE